MAASRVWRRIYMSRIQANTPERASRPSASGGAVAHISQPSSDDGPRQIDETVDAGRLDVLEAYDDNDCRRLTDAIAALLPPDGDVRDEAQSRRPKLYIDQLNMIGEHPKVISKAVIDYAVATEMNWLWTQRNLGQPTIRRYREALVSKWAQIYAAHPPDTEHPENNKTIGCTIYDRVMESVSRLRIYDGALWVEGTSEGHMHHFANGDDREDPSNFVKWHPAYDQEVGE